jgi:peroxiredoxin
MALTESTMLSLGTKVPEFSLPDVVSGKTVSLNDFSDNKALLVMFICRHCPYVVHVQEELARIGKDYKDESIDIIAISSNDPDYDSDDRPERLKEMAEDLNFSFPYLFDETQEVAKAFTAACTPDFFLFDKDKQLVYRGQLDNSRPGSGQPVTGKDLREAMDATLSGKSVSEEQRPSSGCNIKWK